MPATYQAYLLNLLEELKKIIDIKVLTYKKDNRADYTIKSYGLKDRIQRLAFKTKISKNASLDIKVMKNYDIIHIQHSYLFSKLFPLFKKNKNKPKMVITLRGGDTYMKPWQSKTWREFYKINSHFIDAFITMSHHQKEHLTKWGIDNNKIHVIPISFGNKNNALPKYPNTEILKLVSVYRMCWEKNIEGTIRVAKGLKEKNIPFMFDIYGDGNDLSQLYYLIDKFKLSNEINVMGKVENVVIKERLRDYDFLLQLSISEALPTTVLEAQSEGLPCIVSNSDGLPEAVINKKTAIVSDYNNYEYFINEIISLWKDNVRYYSYSLESIKNSNHKFSTDIEIKKLMNLYKGLMREQ